MKTETVEKDYVDAEVISDTAMQTTSAGAIAVATEMSPDGLRAEIAKQKEMRQILVEYVRSELKEGHHFYSFNKLGNPNSPVADKPALSQDGAHLINGLFKAIPGPVKTTIERDGDHFTVYAEAVLFNQNGVQIATGDGMCSTRESKYAYRKGERLCPACGVPAIIKGKEQYGGGWVCFDKKGGCKSKFADGDQSIEGQTVGRVDNPDLADVENTVLKMACKRAAVAATRKLPLVSELFSQDAGEPKERPAASNRQAPAARNSNNQAPPANQKSTTSSVDRAVELANKLLENGVEEEDLAIQFLPEGVAKFSELTEEQAAEAIPSMVEVLNSKLSNKSKSASSVV